MMNGVFVVYFLTVQLCFSTELVNVTDETNTVYSVSKKKKSPPPEIFWHFLPNG